MKDKYEQTSIFYENNDVNNSIAASIVELSYQKANMDTIYKVIQNDFTNENANMSTNTPAGQMMNVASFMSKEYALKYLISPKYAEAHKNGDIHIHDLDYYPSKTTTCLQYDLAKIFKNGFWTKNGFVREPQSIQSYATLATIIFQTHQNEQHGGQAIPAFDYYMAPGVLKSFKKRFYEKAKTIFEFLDKDFQNDEIKLLVNEVIESIVLTTKQIKILAKKLSLSTNEIIKISALSLEQTTLDTFQAMEGFIHNLNTMHSRGGNQVVFSSINYGTDTSPEGRMVIKELLKATQKGLGKSETPIFPIQIFKVKDGISYTEEDYHLAIANWDEAENNKLDFKAKNFDLLLEACKTNSTRLFPNFVFLDSTFNQHENWDHSNEQNYLNEVATMGCRTRVFENVNGSKTSVSRGNLSFTTINLPRLAIQAKREIQKALFLTKLTTEQFTNAVEKKFLEKLENMTYLVAEQLKERYDYQKTAIAKQFPFIIKNNSWNFNKTLNPTDQIGDLFAQGSLSIGFIGGHNAMKAIYQQGHGKSDQAWRMLYDAILLMNKIANEYKEKYNLNYSIIASPAEGLSGRFVKMDRKLYGSITGVTDKDYYVNSFHIDVAENISIFDKIKKEAPFHEITLAGHITYIELDASLKYNIPVILKIIKTMYDQNVGYGSINHPVDTCLNCGFTSVIKHNCPKCESLEIRRIRRITGYLTGDLSSWNSAKRAEEKDRVKHND